MSVTPAPASADAEMLARLTYVEYSGESDTEAAMVMWCVLNRVDEGGGAVDAVITAPISLPTVPAAPSPSGFSPSRRMCSPAGKAAEREGCCRPVTRNSGATEPTTTITKLFGMPSAASTNTVGADSPYDT